MKTLHSNLIPEFASQAMLMLVWPDENTDWQDLLNDIQLTYIHIIQQVSQRVTPWIICRHEKHIQKIHQKLEQSCSSTTPKFNPEFSICEYNDTWIRDYGPLVSQNREEKILNNFTFTGWGNKFSAELDNQVSEHLWNSGAFHKKYLPLLKTRNPAAQLTFQTHDFVLEGGSIDANKQGEIISSEACLLNINRGHSSKTQIHQYLKKKLGIKKTHWISVGQLEGDDTDAHIDTLVRFVNNNTLVIQTCDDPKDAHYKSFKKMKEEIMSWKIDDLTLIPLPWPAPQYSKEGRRLPATYANFIILNGAILIPVYGCKQDEIAINALKKSLGNFQIIPVNSRVLLEQNGSLHCATMQLPF